MPTVKGTYITKYDAGGSGDNIIPDGYIKTVQKCWIDQYTYSSSATIGIGLVVEIAVIPQGKKIVGIDVIGLNACGTTTTATIQIGTKIASGVSHATLFLAATTYGATALGMANNVLSASSNLPYELTGGTNRIFLLFAGANQSITAGTITTIVRYT